MADRLIKEYSRTPAGNGIGSAPEWPKEGWTSDQVNGFIRTLMSALKLVYDSATFVEPCEGNDEAWTFTKLSDTQIRLAGPRDVTGQFVDERRIRLTDDVAGVVEGWITAQSYSDPNNDITVELDSGVVAGTTVSVEVSLMELKRPAFTSFGTTGDLVVSATNLATVLGQATPLGTAATKDHGVAAGEVPLNSDLGTAALLDWGTAAGKLVKSEDILGILGLGSIAFHDLPWRTVVPITTETNNQGQNNHWAIPDWEGIAITPADGSKCFHVMLQVYMEMEDVGNLDDVNLHLGADGDRFDYLVRQIAVGEELWDLQTSFRLSLYFSALIQPDAGDKITVSVNNDASIDNSDRIIRTLGSNGTPERSLLVIQEIIGEE